MIYVTVLSPSNVILHCLINIKSLFLTPTKHHEWEIVALELLCFGSREQIQSIPLKRPSLKGRALYSKGRKLSLVCQYNPVLKVPCYCFCVVLKTPLLMYNLSFAFKKKSKCANPLIIYLPLGDFGATFYIDTDIPFYISYAWWLPKN